METTTTSPATNDKASNDKASNDKASPLATGTTHVPEQRRGVLRRGFHAFGQFFYWVVFLPVRLFKARKAAPDVVVVYSVHPSFFLWLLVAVGFLSAWITRTFEGTAGVMGWIYIWLIVYFLFTLLYDFSTKKLALWGGIVMLVWLTAKYVENLREIVLVGHVLNYLAELSPKLDPGMATVISWLLFFPWLGSVLQMILNGRKRFTPNEIGEFHFGEGSELTDRSGLRFRTSYRDVLETVLTFGGGDLVAVDNHQNVIKRWNNIIGLFFLWKYLDRILHQRAVVESAQEDPDKAG
jgi:hypothetical protein